MDTRSAYIAMDSRSAAVAACERSQRCTPPLVPKAAVPWLVFPYGEGMKSQAFHNICDPDNSATCRKSIPELRGKCFWQKTSHRNWLIVACKDKNQESIYNMDKWNHGDCFLWNPVSLEHIRLPSLLEWISKPKKHVLIDCVLTSPVNIQYEYEENSQVMFLFSTPFNKKDDALLLFCHPGDRHWQIKRISTGDSAAALVSLHCLRGKLYATFERDDRLLEIEKDYMPGNNVKILSVMPFELVSGNPKFSPVGADCIDFYYVDSDDEIFKIWVCLNSRCKQVMSIYVWRLDFSSMKWEEMNDLGDHVIFAGTKTGFCCSAAKLGLISGGLYYTLPDDHTLYKFRGNGGNAVVLPCIKLQTPWFPSEWIMMMYEDGRKTMEDKGEDEEQQEEDFKEVEENKTDTSSNTINGSRDERKHSEEETSPWDNLNEDALAVISFYTHPLDYVHLRSVCKANRRVMPPSTQKRGSISTGRPYIYPWLMFPRNNNYNFVDPVHDNESYLMTFCELAQGATVRCQKDGWLLMSREKKIFFYNPFTREIIKLPDVPDCFGISIIYFNGSPTSSACVVFAIDLTAFETYILMTLRGEDDWGAGVLPVTNVEKKLMTLHGIAPIIYRDVFYCVDCEGTLGAYDVRKGVRWSVLAKPKKIFNDDMHPNFLVECGGDLLLIKLGHLGTAVRIFKLDLPEMEWVKVDNLGKHMLFISETSCLSAIAPSSRLENTICFPRVYLNGGGILLYSLETGCYHSSSFVENTLKKSFHETEGWLSNCTWIQPNWSKSTQQQLDWLNRLCRY